MLCKTNPVIMKTIRFFSGFAVLFFVSFFNITELNAQCISSFPYVEDFEDFDSINIQSVCNTSVRGDTANGWIQDQSDGGEWRSDSSGTGSVGTGPGSTDSTSGAPGGRDFNPGTSSGIYMYTEASATGNACANTVANLISPCFDLSGTKYYDVKLAYHMHGAAMGSLHIDVFDSTKWVTDVWSVSGDQGERWQAVTIPLYLYQRSGIRIRIRAVIGRDFRSDMAIDDFRIEEANPPDQELELTESLLFPSLYHHVPFSQNDSITFGGVATNRGVKTATNVKILAQNGSYIDSVNIGSLTIQEKDTGFIARKHLLSTTANYVTKIFVKADQSDANAANDTFNVYMRLNDSIYSRDNDSLTLGLGFNGAANGELGSMFELVEGDTLTSLGAHIGNLAGTGDSVKLLLYEFGSNVPGNVIDSTAVIYYRGGGYYTAALSCPRILKKGRYFVSVKQLTINNANVGYSDFFYTPNVSFFRGGGGAWTEIADAGFTGLFMVRMHLGRTPYPDTKIIALDTACSGKKYNLQASGAFKYDWAPSNLFQDPTKELQTLTPENSFSVSLTGYNRCGAKTTATKDIVINRTPEGIMSDDTTACKGDFITLKASGGSGYQWVDGPANRDWNYQVLDDARVDVIIDTTNGCTRRLSVNVTASQPTVEATADTTICAGYKLLLNASGANSYQWLNGPANSTYAVRTFADAQYIVEGKDALGCSDFDTVNVTTIAGPDITVSNDTAVCFGQRVTLEASGGVSYEWDGGPQTSSYNFLPLTTKYYYVNVERSNGCVGRDSVEVEVGKRPVISISNDTTICEGSTITLEVVSSDDATFEWNTGQSGKTLSVSPTEATTYTMTASNAIGCFSQDSVRVEVDPLPRAGFSYSLTARDVTFSNTSTNADSYLWEFGDGTDNTDRNTFHRYAQDGDYTVVLTATNDCGSDDTTVVIKIENLGYENLRNSGYQVYPNPASTSINIQKLPGTPLQYDWEIYDVNGKLVTRTFEFIQQSDYRIDVSHFTPGVYFLEITDEHGLNRIKFVKE